MAGEVVMGRVKMGGHELSPAAGGVVYLLSDLASGEVVVPRR